MITAPGKKSEIESLISKDYIAVSNHETVGKTVASLRDRKKDFQSKVAYLYVTDDDGKLIGVLRTRDLLIEDPTESIARVMKPSAVHVLESATLEEVLRMFRTHSFFALPVVDDQARLVGVIPGERVQKYLAPGTRMNFYQFTNFSQEEMEGKGVGEIVLKRLPWLLISVVSGLACAYLLGIFIGKVESIIALILFVPIILGLAGSAGTQSAAIANHGLREGKLGLGRLARVLMKEIVVSLLIGGVAFLAAALIALLWKKTPVEGIALGLSIVAAMTTSGVLGIILAIAFKVFRVGSNFASGLFLLLICDIVALILYFVISLSLISPGMELG